MAPFDAERRTVFGCPVYFVNNNMLIGAHEDRIMLRLPDADQEKLFVAHPEAAPFEPMGRRMKEYVVLPDSLYNDEAVFEEWFRRAYAYVAALPPQERKGRRRSAAR